MTETTADQNRTQQPGLAIPQPRKPAETFTLFEAIVTTVASLTTGALAWMAHTKSRLLRNFEGGLNPLIDEVKADFTANDLGSYGHNVIKGEVKQHSDRIFREYGTGPKIMKELTSPKEPIGIVMDEVRGSKSFLDRCQALMDRLEKILDDNPTGWFKRTKNWITGNSELTNECITIKTEAAVEYVREVHKTAFKEAVGGLSFTERLKFAGEHLTANQKTISGVVFGAVTLVTGGLLYSLFTHPRREQKLEDRQILHDVALANQCAALNQQNLASAVGALPSTMGRSQ